LCVAVDSPAGSKSPAGASEKAALLPVLLLPAEAPPLAVCNMLNGLIYCI
jgi:hypothetical protein